MQQPSANEIMAFLKTTHALGGDCIELFETHAALIFVGAQRALKAKRAVRYDYLDFSTLKQRQAACFREIELNKPHAPEIYDRVVAITREADGTLAIEGQGETVEWALLMRRFEQQDVLSNRIEAGPLTGDILKRLAEAVVRYHAAAPAVGGIDSPGRMAEIIQELGAAFARLPACFAEDQRAEWTSQTLLQLDLCRNLLGRRAQTGQVRRCHGDLHLGNIVLWQGEPTPFDAIEFDEKLAVIDTLYDLSFLLMDLDERGYGDAANAVLNRYLWLRNLASDLEALSALPLFLSLRAGVRAMVSAQRAALRPTAAAEADIAAARRYFGASLGYLSPASAYLVAIGGLSGTGKSTLAARLSPSIGAAPGALHLRSDLERKSMFGVEETARLPAETYNAASSDAVYARIMEKAALALKAGHSVVVDAVFAKPAEKQQIETIAERCGVSFRGVWLSAPGSILKERVDARNNDASDATSHVVERQLLWDSSPDGWAAVDASGPMDATFAMAISVLRLPQK